MRTNLVVLCIFLILAIAVSASAQTAVTECGVIDAPGTYVLERNISNGPSDICIDIQSGGVVLDGQNHTISGRSGSVGIRVPEIVTTDPGNESTDVAIRNVTVRDGVYGIYAGCDGMNISTVTLLNNYAGLFVAEAYQVVIRGSRLEGNGAGIDIADATLIAVSNQIVNNTVGVVIGPSLSGGGSVFYDNNFTNTNNFFIWSEEGSGREPLFFENTWNSTFSNASNIMGAGAFGGNYWATPNGTGFSQTCADADADFICDDPFSLAPNNTDYLPLALPGNRTVTAMGR
ncbi:MAG: NosD domain-containing protein [Methanomicrobiales archaeon]|nr:NosD domain-containing protein [Methanomicrobiales archaeon]